MSEKPDIAGRVRRALDDQRLDPATRDTLADARRDALDVDKPRKPAPWVSAAAVAAILLIVSGVLDWTQTSGPEALPLIPGDELALIAGDEEFELILEYEFYHWFDTQEESG